MTVKDGDAVVVVDASGDEHRAVARSGVESAGHSFPVVWIEWADGQRVPWPAEAVRRGGVS